MKAPLPDNEIQRLGALHNYDVLDTPPETAFDDMTLLAAQICQVPIVLITLIDESRQWFKSKIGVNMTETSRDIAFCAHAILYSDELLEVRDTQLDPRFTDNPLVTADPHIRFYTGSPLVSPDGFALGTLCVLDYVPRVMNTEQKSALRALSRSVIAHLELRRTLVAHRQTAVQLQMLNTTLEQKVEARTAQLKTAYDKLTRLTKLYSALSQCNQAIVRCPSEMELLPQVCRDAVNFGGMKMAWVGMLNETTGLVKSVASFGTGIEYLEGIEISVDADNPTGRGPVGTAIRGNLPVWCQDFQHDPATVAWHERGADFGWNSIASLPLRRNGVTVGAFNLYSDTTNAFDEAAQNLLLEMARDISYALDRFDADATRKQEQAQLRKLSQVVEQSPNVILITDLDANIEYVNAAFIKTTGYSFTEVIGKNPRLLQSGKTPRSTYVDMWAQLRNGDSWQGEFINKRKDGSEYIVSVYISPMTETEGRVTHYLGIKEDITEQKCSDERIHYLANFDVLTGLPNRIQLADHIKYVLSLAKRNDEHLAVMFIDLDHFKDINGTLGHSVGDAFLVEVARRLQSILREEDMVSRLGGDEFILVLSGGDANGAAQAAQKLLQAISAPYRIQQYDLIVSASIGIALYPDDGVDMESLSRCADTAMYRAKQEGRNDYRFFTSEMQAHVTRNMQLVNALRHALEHGQLLILYQPQISILDGLIIGVEALLRWQHPELGNVAPAEFIPVAENCGLILPIGEWVLRKAVQQLKHWLDKRHQPLVMSVNLSAIQFRHPHLPDLVSNILNEAQLPPEYLELELTEGVAMHDPAKAIAIMDNLHERGIHMSIDDFGTGYSSLSYLKKFKTYKLKIDQSFVRDINVDLEDKAIVAAIISMAKSLGLKTIAEGVENVEQLAFLREQGCDEAQGYYYSKPLSAEQMEEFLTCNKA